MKDIRAGHLYEVTGPDGDQHDGQNEWVGEGMNARKRKSEWKAKKLQESEFSLKLESPGPAAGKWFQRPASDLRVSFQEKTPQREFVASLHNWSMDVITLSETVGHPLPLMFTYLIETNELMDHVSNVQQLENFLFAIENNYRLSNPYHNALHAADVLFSVFWILHSCFGQKVIGADELDIFAMLFAAMVHDLDHPGETNAYQIAVKTSFALLYNDRSVLENHHVAFAHKCLEAGDTNIFSRLEGSKRQEIRAMVINMVLATDMAKHFHELGQLNGRLSEGGFPDPNKPKDKELLMNMVVHACDMCNPSKDTPLAVKWTTLVMTEFFAQGDKEQSQGVPMSLFMNRRTTNIGTCQVGFIDLLVSPLYAAMVQVLPGLAVAVENIASNRRFWRSIIDVCAERIEDDDPVTPEELSSMYDDYKKQVEVVPD
jgi:hypothetical protein